MREKTALVFASVCFFLYCALSSRGGKMKDEVISLLSVHILVMILQVCASMCNFI